MKLKGRGFSSLSLSLSLSRVLNLLKGSRKPVVYVILALLIVGAFLSTFLFVPPAKNAHAASSSWWHYRKAITVNNTGNANELTNYQVKITLNNTNFDFSKAKSDGSDIRFYDSDEITAISYWIESYDSVGQTAVLWSKVPDVPASSNKTIYMCYGNSEASSASNGDSTFAFFDDFNGVTKEVVANNAASPTITTGTGGYLGENIVYDSVTAKYWWIFQDSVGHSLGPDVIRLASASDINGAWTVEASPVISSASNSISPHIAKFGDYWYIYYGSDSTGVQKIYVQKSSSVNSGYSESGISNPILDIGPVGAWDNNRVAEPYVFEEGGIYYLFYMGESVGTLYEKTGYATSSSPDSGFIKYANNPVLSGDSLSGWNAGQDKAADPFVFKKDGIFYIGTTATASGKYGWTEGFFKTTDFINYTAVNSNPVLLHGATGSWDNTEVVRGAVSEFNGTYYFPYTGFLNGSTGFKMGMTTLQFNVNSQIVDTGKWTKSGSPSISGSNITTSLNNYVTSIATYGQNYDLRSRSKLDATLFSFFGFRSLTTGKYFEFISNYPSANNVRGYQHDSADVGSANLATPNVWAIYDIARNGSTSGVYSINNSQLATLNTQVTSDSLPVLLRSGVVSDWVLVRKYSSPDPTTTVGSEVVLIPPSVTVQAADGIATSSAVLYGTITDAGTQNATTRGFKYYQSNDCSGAENDKSENGNFGAEAYSLNLTGLISNTIYSYQAYATSPVGTGASSSCETFTTLANVPSAPTINATSTTSLTAIINQNSNPAGTGYAIYETTTSKYVQANGTLNTSAVWQDYTTWGGGSGVVVTGLSTNVQYTFEVKAKNGDNTETSLSSGASKYTLIESISGITFSGVTASAISVTSTDTPSNLASDSSGIQICNTTISICSAWQQNITPWQSASLNANTQYTFTIQSRNGDGIVAALFNGPGNTQYTLANVPWEPSPSPTSAPTTTPSSSLIPTPAKIIQAARQYLNTLLASFSVPSPHAFDSPFIFDASESFSAKGIEKYAWDFGDGTKAEGMKAEHQYQTPGRYTVILTITDNAGKTAAQQQTVGANPTKPTVENISADGNNIVFKGKSYPKTIVHLEIHSNPLSVQTNTDEKGEWVYKIADASNTLGTGDHIVLAKALYVLADKTELTSDPSKTYDFKVSLDDGKLKVEMEKTRTWQYIALGLVLIIVIGFVLNRVRKRRKI